MRTLIAVVLLSFPVAAQPVKKAPKPQVLKDFEDEVVETGTARSDLELVGPLRHKKQSSLIKIRESFKPEMMATALRL